ncbi:MAG: formate C-acetyltransferase/glycerol dehydratase family glycyl radical enzyme [Treponema sp.]|jgi:formate C-acetyltransferase|nr:formate C-acetyltransferase/glycerol dehydratase family glycyl radical enzyme [Treponema sp.]
MNKNYLPQGLSREDRTKKLNGRMRDQRPGVCTERARLVTESDKNTPGEPVVIKRAKALNHILSSMSVYILEDELIVGHHASKLRYAPIFPEICSFSEKELDLFPVRKVDTLQISSDDKNYLLKEIFPYWEGKKLADLTNHYFPEDLKKELSRKNRIFNPISRTRSGYGHYVPDFPLVLNGGFVSVEKRAEKALRELSDFDPCYSEKMHFYQSVVIICGGIKTFAERYSALAAEMAGKESNGRRKRELELIASVCARVPYYPAENFHEALQSYYFILLIDYIFQNGSAVSAGRFDQYMYPFYKTDIEKGFLVKEEAQELLEALLVQHLDIIKAGAYESVKNNGGFATTIHMTLSGVDRNGNDAVNELTYLTLDADKHVFNSEPNIGVRISGNTPDDVIEKVLTNLVSLEGGKYPIFNDDAVISALERDGVTPDDAADYSVVGCVEPTPSGNTMGLTNACFFNVAKCLELALNNGVCMLGGDEMGVKTGDVSKMDTFDDVWNAFYQQLEYFCRKATLAMNIIVDSIARFAPHIYCSMITKDCIERGIDSAAGGARYNYVGIQGVGIIDTADSLLALKQIVFEEKKKSLAEFRDILQKNYEGEEIFRQYCINRVPKYGNDIDEADILAAKVAESYCKTICRGKDFRGGAYRAGMYCLSSNTPIGRQTGALPSGRLAETPLGDGGLSPKHGMDVCGPTASAKSVAKIDHSLAVNGVNFNQKYLAGLMRDRDNRVRLTQLIRTYFKMKGFQIQFNILSPETLKNAQAHPEAYRSLVVRVAGYSAFFVELDAEIQNEIISRTELIAV